MTIRKPFKYITKKYHFSRAGLYQRINKIPNFKKKHMIKKDNKWLIDLDGIKQITKPKHNSTAKFKHTRKGIKNSLPTKSDYHNSVKKLLNITHNQQEAITKLVNTNHSQQENINKLTDKIIDYSNRLNDYSNYNKSLTEQIKLNHSWLWRLFHKHTL